MNKHVLAVKMLGLKNKESALTVREAKEALGLLVKYLASANDEARFKVINLLVIQKRKLYV